MSLFDSGSDSVDVRDYDFNDCFRTCMLLAIYTQNRSFMIVFGRPLRSELGFCFNFVSFFLVDTRLYAIKGS